MLVVGHVDAVVVVHLVEVRQGGEGRGGEVATVEVRAGALQSAPALCVDQAGPKVIRI